MTEQRLRRALVVDDNPMWLKTLSRLIRGIGYSISAAQTYTEALLEVERSQVPPDLVVTDVRLSDHDESNTDGLRLLQELSGRGQLRASIVVTGYPSPETRRIAAQLGAVYLEKGNFTTQDFRRESRKLGQNPPTGPGPRLQVRGRLVLATA